MHRNMLRAQEDDRLEQRKNKSFFCFFMIGLLGKYMIHMF